MSLDVKYYVSTCVNHSIPDSRNKFRVYTLNFTSHEMNRLDLLLPL